MIEVNIFEVKAKLSEYIDRASKGDRVVIYRHNKPVAELRGIQGMRTEPRPIGPLPGRPAFKVPASFFDELQGEDLRLWEGANSVVGNPARPRAPRTVKAARSRKKVKAR
jgi:prevent-host-death family protein